MSNLQKTKDYDQQVDDGSGNAGKVAGRGQPWQGEQLTTTESKDDEHEAKDTKTTLETAMNTEGPSSKDDRRDSYGNRNRRQYILDGEMEPIQGPLPFKASEGPKTVTNNEHQ